MTAADKPRADLVALFDAFARLPEGHASLSLRGDLAGEVLEGWAAVCGHRVEAKSMCTPLNGRWTMLEVRVDGGTISVHLESVRGTAQADQQVIARVQAALDGEQPQVSDGRFRCDRCRSVISGPAGAQCPFEHRPVGHAVEQPAAEGGV